MDIFTPLYHEGEHFFLPGEYLSYVADKIREGGGEEIPRYHSDFFSQIQIFFSYSLRFVSPGEWQVCIYVRLFITP